MADFTRLLAGETAEDVAEVFDSGITEKAQECADHVRCGKFENLISKAHTVTEQKTAEQVRAAKSGKGMLCVTGNNTQAVSLEANLNRLTRVNAKLRENEQTEALQAIASKEDVLLKNSRVACDSLKMNSAYAANAAYSAMEMDIPMQMDDDLTELQRMRQARVAQLRREKIMTEKWREMGHGSLRLITDQRDFFLQVKGRERSIVVIHRHGDPNCDVENTNSFMSLLSKLSEKHMETGIYHMHEDKAAVMLSMLDIPDGGCPVLFILRHGEVICRISRNILLDPNLVKGGGVQKFERLLRSRDAFGEGRNGGNNDDDGDESEEDDNHIAKHRQKLEFRKA